MPKKKNSESKRITNLIPSKEIEKDWTFNNAVEAEMLNAGPVAALPPSVDLRENWWTVGDQGNTGACVGWACAEGVLRWHFAKANRIANSQSLSPRYIWMASKEVDIFNTRPTTFIESEGTSLKDALDIARKFGVIKDSVLPFNSGSLYQGSANTFYATASLLKIASYFNLFKNTNDWKNWLATKGPLLVGLNVDSTWDNAAQTSGNLDVFQPNTVRGGHAVVVVGYQTNGRFIIRNSWGTNWGKNGFGFATEQYIKDAFFNESYGVML
ncbi:MAG: C1 family peptidase [Pyrinomonadaceae bacterium]|nr:C1 family peptidase [Pyrinomonadaceae bacterium]